MRLKNFIEEFLCLILGWIPTFIGRKLRGVIYKYLFNTSTVVDIGKGVTIRGVSNMSFGKNVVISDGCFFYARDGGSISVGDNVAFNSGCHINAAFGSISIGSESIFGVDALLRSSDHEYRDRYTPIRQQGHIQGAILIGYDCWIASRVIILSGVTINDGSVVGAGAVVTKDIPQHTVAVGVPALPVKHR